MRSEWPLRSPLPSAPSTANPMRLSLESLDDEFLSHGLSGHVREERKSRGKSAIVTPESLREALNLSNRRMVRAKPDHVSAVTSVFEEGKSQMTLSIVMLDARDRLIFISHNMK